MNSLRHLLENKELLSPQRLQLLRYIAEQATIRKSPAYVVGGLARDLLLMRPVGDFDVVIEGDAISFARSLVKTYGGKVTAHQKFGTAKWFMGHLDGNPASFLDLITARSETYKSSAALPTVKFSTLSDDILRRDFTINTLAVRLDGDHFGELRDDLDARADLDAGIVRVLHPHSFLDDPTRMYRAVRYEQRYGFEIEPDTLSLVPEAGNAVKKLSAQRIRHELDLILDEANAMFILARLAELDLLKPIHPDFPVEIPNLSKLYRAGDLDPAFWTLVAGATNNRWRGPNRDLLWLLLLSPLPKAKLESLNKRLAFTADLMKWLLSASSLLSEANSLIGSLPSEWVQKLDKLPVEAGIAVYLLSEDFRVQDALHVYLETWRHIKPITTGDDLKKLGLEPGPRFQEILFRLRAARLDGVLKTNEEERAFLKRLLEEHS